MQYIQRDKLVHIEWSIFRGTSQVPEDFSRALVKMFLIGGNEKYLLTATAEGGKLLADLPSDLPEGAYSLEAIWVKNYGNLLPHRQPLTPGGEPVCPRRPVPHPNDPCFIHPHDNRFNDRCLMRSRKDYVFALTDYPSEETVTGESGEVTVRLASAVATYGYDGLSAYQIAVMRGDFSGTEGEYQESLKYKLEAATETTLGGIKAAQKTAEDTVEVKIDPETGKLYVSAAESGQLEAATETTLGGIKAAAKTDNETVEVKIGSDEKLYVPASQGEELKAATETTLGGIRAATKTSLETQEVKIDPATGKLYTQPGGEGGTEIINNPDEEDLHSVEKTTDVHVLQFADKEYNASAFSGLGRVYLRKNISSNKNILTQAMLSKANTRYIIQYDYDLDGETITVPEGCTLDFQGGSFNNGTLSGNHTKIKAELDLIFHTNLTLSGIWTVDVTHPEWFGTKGDGNADDTVALQKAFDFCMLAGGYIYISKGVSYYKLSEGIQVYLNTNKSIVVDSDNAELRLSDMPSKPLPSGRNISNNPEYAVLCIYSYANGQNYNNGNATRAIVNNLLFNGEGVPLVSNINNISSSTPIVNGVYIDASLISLENISVNECFGTGLRFVGANELSTRNILIKNVGGRPGTPNYPNNSSYTKDNFGDGIYIGYTPGGACIELVNIKIQGYTTLGYKSRAGIVFEYCKGNYKAYGTNIIIDYFSKSFHIEEANSEGSYYYFNNVKCTHSNIPFAVSVGSDNYYYLNNFYLECLDNGDGREDVNWFLLYGVTRPTIKVCNSHLFWDNSEQNWCNVYSITFEQCSIDGNNSGVYFTGSARYNHCTFYRVGNNSGNMTFYSGGSNKTRQYLNGCKFENCNRIYQSGVYLYSVNSYPDNLIMYSGDKTNVYINTSCNANLDISIPIYHLGDTSRYKLSGSFSLYMYIGTPSNPDNNVYRSIAGTFVLDRNTNDVDVQNPVIYGNDYTINISEITVSMTKSQLRIQATISNTDSHSVLVQGFID